MDSLKVVGIITIYKGDKKEEVMNVYKNLFLNAGKTEFIKLLSGTGSTLPGYSYFVVGDGLNEVKTSDITLSNERFRKTISNITTFSNRIVVDTFIEASEGNFIWREIGLVAGGELGVLNTGTLLNRALINEEKNSGLSITVSWEISIE